MASWMVHLRIADRLLDSLPGLSAVDFVVGNIAPDSGIPNEDWSGFTPSVIVSHFRVDHSIPKNICIPAFVERYFTPEQRTSYSPAQNSFFLGYLVHLLTDQLWSAKVLTALMERFPDQWQADRQGLIVRAKEDWYDLDYKYLRQHPDFRAFRIYSGAVGYKNVFMSELRSLCLRYCPRCLAGLAGRSSIGRWSGYAVEGLRYSTGKSLSYRLV